MNQEQLYDHVVHEFPATWPTSPEWVWVNVHDGSATDLTALRAVLDKHIPSSEVIVVVHSSPGVAAALNKESAGLCIAEHILKHEIQAADPRFESFVLVSTSGVATGWVVPVKSSRAAEASDDA